MGGFRDPGFRFFEPSDLIECVSCHEIASEEVMHEGTAGEVICFDCFADLGA